MKHLPLREVAYAIAFVVALFVLYAIAYLALMIRVDLGISSIAGEETPMVTYRFGGESSEWFFAPAHEVDRRLRLELWRNERDQETHRRIVAIMETIRSKATK